MQVALRDTIPSLLGIANSRLFDFYLCILGSMQLFPRSKEKPSQYQVCAEEFNLPLLFPVVPSGCTGHLTINNCPPLESRLFAQYPPPFEMDAMTPGRKPMQVSCRVRDAEEAQSEISGVQLASIPLTGHLLHSLHSAVDSLTTRGKFVRNHKRPTDWDNCRGC